jgi:hypothetical protein
LHFLESVLKMDDKGILKLDFCTKLAFTTRYWSENGSKRPFLAGLCPNCTFQIE